MNLLGIEPTKERGGNWVFLFCKIYYQVEWWIYMVRLSVVINLYLKGKLSGKCAIERESKSVGIRVENAEGRRNPPVRTALRQLLTFPGENFTHPSCIPVM